ncbi:MAG TPA: amidohydrolase [Negativicutes bacterium]|nr:amidohydrolase [Negativicutes bacterium]
MTNRLFILPGGKIWGRYCLALSVGILLMALCFTSLANASADDNYADYVFTHGKVYTMNPAAPWQQAVAVKGNKIIYVGDDMHIAKYMGKTTREIELKGAMLLPGFIESHIHPTAAVVTAGADLQYDSLEELLKSIKAWADANPDEKIVSGFGWRYNLFDTNGPSKQDLDKIIPDRPVFLFAIDGHSAWVNSKALEMANITAETPDPEYPFSYFKRDEKTGELTGWLVEVPAEVIVKNRLDETTPAAVEKVLKKQLALFSAAGITAVFDAGINVVPTEVGLDIYQKIEKESKLPLRVVASYYWNNPQMTDPVEKVLALKAKYYSELVQVKALKINVDGGDLQHTAVMLQPYADRPGFYGDFLLNPSLINDAVMKAQASGIDTHSHAYGDGAVKAHIDAVELARKAYPNSKSRHTIGHGIYMNDAEIERLVKQDMIAQFSAQWAVPDPSVEVQVGIIGEEIAYKEYMRIASIVKAGGRIAFGTDWPAAGYSSVYKPLEAIQVATTRDILTQYGQRRFLSQMPPTQESVSLEKALKAYTMGSAYVLGLEDKIGSIEVGKLADLVLLEKNLFDVPKDQLSATKVLFTMSNGKIVFASPELIR